MGDFVLVGGQVQFNVRLVTVATGEVSSAANLTGKEADILALAVRLGDATVESLKRKVVVVAADPDKPKGVEGKKSSAGDKGGELAPSTPPPPRPVIELFQNGNIFAVLGGGKPVTVTVPEGALYELEHGCTE